MNNSHMRAYGHGMLDGYNTGSNNNPYDPEEKAEEHQAYEMGYSYGVTLYCLENEVTA